MSTTALPTACKMLFALLRASLHERDVELSYFQGVTHDDWKQCYRLSVTQGVMALAWDGVVRLPYELMPPLAVKIPWATNVEAYEKRYMKYCKTAVELSDFYARHGIKTVVLKGVGLSTLYPVPSHREGGDIDIYTYSTSQDLMSDKQANSMADLLMQEKGIDVDAEHSYKHSLFHYNGVAIENHRSFLNVEAYRIAMYMEKLLKENISPALTSLPVGEVMTPSAVFNTLFISLHAFQHYCAGMTLHHLCDWAMVISRYGLHIPSEVNDKSYIKGIHTLTMLCNRYLGTDISVGGDEKLADDILSEMLYPRYSKVVPSGSKIQLLIYKIRRLFYSHRRRSKILRELFVNVIWRSIISHIRNPHTIFHR